ncbi:EAL domain-containing protein [Rhodoferax sp.]|uniref:EAL domain-containing protein n=1 Tax=Rhodoferax sp. TaxID=50421 RepID=UPI0025DAA0B5|nr:EAL domain-containing protein [Rhodoferax sp.]
MRITLRCLLLGSLRRQLVLGMASVVALTMALMLWQLAVREHEELLTRQTEQAAAMAESIALSSSVWVASRDVAGLQEIVESSSRYPDVRYAIVLDRRGQVLAHTDPARLGQFMDDLPAEPRTRVLQDSDTLLDIASPVMLDSLQLGWVRIGMGRTQLHSQINRMLRNGVGYLLTSMVLIGALASLTGLYFTRRLNTISAVADAVQAGDTGRRVAIGGTDEAARLARNVNHMLDTLQTREQELRASRDELRIAATAFESNDVMFVCDAEWNILQVNSAFQRVTGYRPEEAIGHKPRDLLGSGMHTQDFYEAMNASIRDLGCWQGEVWDRRKSGETFPAWSTITAVRSDHGEVTHYVANLSDFSAHKAAENEIKTLVYFDSLTMLPNRRMLMGRLETAMQAALASGHLGALLFIDLDDFKTLNDTLGHHQGDVLLQQVAHRLQGCVREVDTVARLGGDEFVVMLEGLSKDTAEASAQAQAVAEKIMRALNQPYDLGTLTRNSTPSVGVTVFGTCQEMLDEPLKRADLAMYQAKAAGRNTMRLFDPKTQAAVTLRADLESALRTALEENQFVLYLQPQISEDASVLGAEALVRWQHPDRGLVMPGEFITVAEDCGMIVPIGNWVLNTACRQLAVWAHKPGFEHLTIAVNVSAKQFHQVDFVERVLDALDHHGALASRLKIEITESMLIANVDDVITRMEELQHHGVGFAMDDFGTGYSSLGYLKRLPLDVLKIDQSFVRDVLVDSNDAAIANMIVALANSLGLSVIAEGVETVEQMHYLAQHGCHAYQGYLFSRPLPVDRFEASMSDFLLPLHSTNSVKQVEAPGG